MCFVVENCYCTSHCTELKKCVDVKRNRSIHSVRFQSESQIRITSALVALRRSFTRGRLRRRTNGHWGEND